MPNSQVKKPTVTPPKQLDTLKMFQGKHTASFSNGLDSKALNGPVKTHTQLAQSLLFITPTLKYQQDQTHTQSTIPFLHKNTETHTYLLHIYGIGQSTCAKKGRAPEKVSSYLGNYQPKIQTHS